MSAALQRIRAVCDDTLPRLAVPEIREEVERVRARLGEPLRIAIAGRTNAGKSTLVNALIGRRVAATDVRADCTRVVAFYAHDDGPSRAEARLRDGGRMPVLLTAGDALPVALGVPVASVEHVWVRLRSSPLRRMTVIDTPGLASADDEVSLATTALLESGEADALVVCITRSAMLDHAETVADFRENVGGASASPLNAVAVLAKADTIGTRVDLRLEAAERVRAEAANALRGAVGSVVPVIALLAQTAHELREEDADALATLAAEPADTRAALTRDVRSFARVETPLPAEQMQRLRGILQLFGVAACLEWIDHGCRGASALAERLAHTSGVENLVAEIEHTLQPRANVLKAASAMAALDRIAWRPDGARDAGTLRGLRTRLEDLRLEPELHAIAEHAALQRLSTGRVELPEGMAEDMHRLATAERAGEKLGVGAAASPRDRERAALSGIERWQGYISGGRCSPAQEDVARVAYTSYMLLWEQATGEVSLA